VSDYAHRRPPESTAPDAVRRWGSGSEQGPVPEHLLPAKVEADRRERQRTAERRREADRRAAKLAAQRERRERTAAAPKRDPGPPTEPEIKPLQEPAIQAETEQPQRFSAGDSRVSVASLEAIERLAEAVEGQPARREPWPVRQAEPGGRDAARQERARAVVEQALAEAEQHRAELGFEGPDLDRCADQLRRLREILVEAGVPASILARYAAVIEHLEQWASAERWRAEHHGELVERPGEEPAGEVAGPADPRPEPEPPRAEHLLEQLADEARLFGGQGSRAIPGRRETETPEQYAYRVVERLYAIGARARGRELAVKIRKWERGG
jgi:hypothetical protein